MPWPPAGLQQIQGLKEASGIPPDSITCATARSAPTETQSGDPQAKAATIPEGLMFTNALTAEDWTGCGPPNDGPETQELAFQNGYVYLYHIAQGSTERTLGDKEPYKTYRDRLQLEDPAVGTMKWTFDGRQLILSDSTSDLCGHRIIWTKQPWTRK